MKIILLQDIQKVGVRGAVADVADGYANNVLIPKKLALPATPANIAKAEKEKAVLREKGALDSALAKSLLAEIDGKSVSIQARANERGGLFEAIHPRQVAEAIQKELNVSVPEDSIILLPDSIKKLGEFRAEINLEKISAEIAVQVEKKP